MKRGFTLVELTVVLVVLAIVTHLAVHELGRVHRAQSARLAERQLREIADAVWRYSPGEEEPSGFVVDMGRLPHSVARTNEDLRVTLTLDELVCRPQDVPPYAVRPAALSNLVVAADVGVALADETVMVQCGWRGPYLRLPPGRERLVDPWNNPMETPDAAGLPRLFLAGGAERADPPIAGVEVRGVGHYGADARADDLVQPTDSAMRDGRTDFLPEGGRDNRLALSVLMCDAGGPASVSGDVRCRWYAPCGGAITGGVESVSLAGGATAAFAFDGLPPGVCTVVVDVGGVERARRRIVLPPGGRAAEIKVAVR